MQDNLWTAAFKKHRRMLGGTGVVDIVRCITVRLWKDLPLECEDFFLSFFLSVFFGGGDADCPVHLQFKQPSAFRLLS